MKPTPATKGELEALREAIEQMRERLPHPVATTAGLRIVWEPRYDVDNGVLGSYSVLRPHEVRLASFGRLLPHLMVPVLAHELRHMWQHHCMGWAYAVAAIPGLRNWTIEPSAYAVEAAAEKLITEVTHG